MTKTTKILSAFFLLATIGLMVYLSIDLKDGNEYRINLILLEGNDHLSKEQYMNFANLFDKSVYGKLSLQIIKDRIEKHPYVQSADVRYDGSGKVSVKIVEKIFDSILLDSSSQYILTENLQLLPVLPGTKKIDYPVISNPLIGSQLKVLSSMKKINDIVIASKIISAVKLLNPELEKDFSSIDLQDGGDVVLFFSSLNYPVIIGKGNEIKKIFYFNSLWNYLKGKEINNYLEYVDLRYGGHVYLGITEQGIEEGQKKL
ncbi:MAG: FtsQ-type POTRA domain-containing protein [Bacteroidota bacterium]